MLPQPVPTPPPHIAEAAVLLRGFRSSGSWWDGLGSLPSWGGKELAFTIRPDGEVCDITARQLAILRGILSYTGDLRPTFESALFAYYKDEIEDSYSAYDPVAHKEIPDSGPPVLKNPSEIWSLIDEPEVWIDSHFRTQTAIEFKMTFNCVWDEEHGLGVQFKDWMPVKIGAFDVW